MNESKITPAYVNKRDGRRVAFHWDKIKTACDKAYKAETDEGMGPQHWEQIQSIIRGLFSMDDDGITIEIESLQDIVETALMGVCPPIARAYVLYREKRAEERRKAERRPDPDAIADYIHPSKYARYLKDKKRRETYLETSHRSRDMHIRRFPQFEQDIRHYWQWVDDKKVLPSMRSMQFGGKPIEQHNGKMYNCCFTLIDRPRAFGETFYLLLCGAGVGFSVQTQHVEKLPAVQRINRRNVRHYEIVDTIQGLADAVMAMIDSAYTGYWVEYNYSRIRPEGTELHTSGGKAPGHMALREMLEALRQIILGAQGRQLSALECHDMICWIARAVLAGGVRRSSLISIFSFDDHEMLLCKTKGVFRYAYGADPGLNSQREMANNSAALLRSTAQEWQLRKLIKISEDCYGDPGFFFTDDLDYGCNPCGEIGNDPVLRGMPHKWDANQRCTVCEQSLKYSTPYCPYENVRAEADGGIIQQWGTTGFSFCNLTTINGAKCETGVDLLQAAEAAAFIGTLQATYNSFPYLGPVTEAIAKRESLLGVSISGIMDSPDVCLDPYIQGEAARAAVFINQKWAAKLGIPTAARVTTIKPDGTCRLELGGIGAGIHYHHAKRYFRGILANPLEPVAQYLYKHNPHMFQRTPKGDWFITFPCQPPDGAKTMKEAKALDFLNAVFSTYDYWITPGTARPDSSPGLTHNVSCTVTMRPEEKEAVIKAVWENRHRIAAMSFAPYLLDKGVPFIPHEECVAGNPMDEARWNALLDNWKPVDYSQMVEEEDMTTQMLEAACVGGQCDISAVTEMRESGLQYIFVVPGQRGYEPLNYAKVGEAIRVGEDSFEVRIGPRKSATGATYLAAAAIRGPKLTDGPK